MKTRLALCALWLAGVAWANDHGVAFPHADAETAAAEEAEALSHNRLVTDAEINEYFEFMIRPDEKALTEWRNLLPEVRTERITEYRNAFDKSRKRIPVLRDMSPKERSDLEAMAPFLAASAASADSARERLLAYSDDDYRVILAAGIELITTRRNGGGAKGHRYRWTQITEDFPLQIAFLRPELVRVLDDSCHIYLHKGIGRGIGYVVHWHQDERWVISSIDEYESWQRTEIKLREL